mmetsp:Transcript_86330/g.241593  ORF Transcript_86330/g.241593 Transcript_86330/m.241593 type:complete len:206 (-) Transcript_86330:98-715(-)
MPALVEVRRLRCHAPTHDEGHDAPQHAPHRQLGEAGHDGHRQGERQGAHDAGHGDQCLHWRACQEVDVDARQDDVGLEHEPELQGQHHRNDPPSHGAEDGGTELGQVPLRPRDVRPQAGRPRERVPEEDRGQPIEGRDQHQDEAGREARVAEGERHREDPSPDEAIDHVARRLRQRGPAWHHGFVGLRCRLNRSEARGAILRDHV